MLGLKNVYLYFLSIKKILIKSLKEIFFQTKFYNNTLNSETPSRFFFQPNPYLLSPLFNHESFKFKKIMFIIFGIKILQKNKTIIFITFCG